MDFRKKDRRGADREVRVERRSGADRRRYDRVLVDLEVDYRCEDTFLFAYITDLSALGIFIRTNNPEPPGTRLNLRFVPPGDETPLELEGEVIWVNPFRPGNFDNINPGMGVRFIDHTHEHKQRLVRLVRKIAYLEDDDADADPTLPGTTPPDTDDLESEQEPEEETTAARATAGESPAPATSPADAADRDSGRSKNPSDEVPVTLDVDDLKQ